MKRLRAVAIAIGALLGVLGASAPAVAEVTSLTSGSVTATLTSSGTFQAPGPISLTMTRAGTSTTFSGLESDPTGRGQVHAVVGQTGLTVFSDHPLRLRDLDGDGEPEAIVRLFSGGAHCCETAVVASYDPATAAYRLTVKDFGDAGWVLRDVGSTGTPEFVSWDYRWAYWGGVYAGSPEPLQIWSFANGAFTDATRLFPAAIRADQRAQWTFSGRARRQGGNYRGALAAYVADGYSLGRPDAAWTRVLAAYRERDRVRFFHALRNQLAKLGYRKAADPTPAVSGAPPGY